jgi:antitoxin component YwqK of YwqJK toxin-antitoxin module
MKEMTEKYILHHKDGTLWASGALLNGKQHGYFEWFRKDGTKMRSGYFDHGQRTGKWTTYDQAGKAYKVTEVSPTLKPPKRRR